MTASQEPPSAGGGGIIEIQGGGPGGERGVRRTPREKPLVYLHGRAKARAERIGLRGLDVSLSHSREYAVAFVVGQSEELVPDREAWREKLMGILRERGLLVDNG